jgi:hypothetical protein
MMSDRVSFVGNAPHDLRVARGPLSDHEKGGRNVEVPEHIQQARRVFGIWSIVEGETDHPATRGTFHDEETPR